MGGRGTAQPGRHRSGRRAAEPAVPGLRRGRRRPRGGQPAHRDRRRALARAGRQGDPRRQRNLPPPRLRRLRRDRRARRARAGGPLQGTAVRGARRHRGRHRQRRRAGHGHRGHRRRGRRHARQLPGHRRRRQRGRHVRRPGGRGRRPGGARHLHQHLRRHHQGRGGGPGHHRGPRAGGHRLADHPAPRRHQRGRGDRDAAALPLRQPAARPRHGAGGPHGSDGRRVGRHR